MMIGVPTKAQWCEQVCCRWGRLCLSLYVRGPRLLEYVSRREMVYRLKYYRRVRTRRVLEGKGVTSNLPLIDHNCPRGSPPAWSMGRMIRWGASMTWSARVGLLLLLCPLSAWDCPSRRVGRALSVDKEVEGKFHKTVLDMASQTSRRARDDCANFAFPI